MPRLRQFDGHPRPGRRTRPHAGQHADAGAARRAVYRPLPESALVVAGRGRQPADSRPLRRGPRHPRRRGGGPRPRLRPHRLPLAAPGRRRTRPARQVPHPENPRPRRHGRRLQGRGPQAQAPRRRQGHAADHGRQRQRRGSASCARPRRWPPSSTTTSSPSTRWTKSEASPSWPWSFWPESRSTSASGETTNCRCPRSCASAGRSPRVWPRRTNGASFTATSSRPTSGWRRREAASRSSTSGWPAPSRRSPV